jgi:hypothetical protein
VGVAGEVVCHERERRCSEEEEVEEQEVGIRGRGRMVRVCARGV